MPAVRALYRSMLFVPGNRSSWVEKGIRSGADALILDLEDAVGSGSKADAREMVAASLRSHGRGDGPALWVRPNAWVTDLAGADLDAVVTSGLTGLFLPKVSSVEELIRFDALITHFEIARGLDKGSVAVLVAIETAEAMVECGRLARGPRVVTLLGSTSPRADVARALGFRWSPEGLESLYLRSRVVMACRAAGLRHPIGGLWEDVADLDGLRAFADQQRQLGYQGQIVIHPSHVAVVNRTFTPRPAEIEAARHLVAAYEQAAAEGRGAAVHEGQHIDVAHVKSARDVLALAAAIDARAGDHRR